MTSNDNNQLDCGLIAGKQHNEYAFNKIFIIIITWVYFSTPPTRGNRASN